MRLQEALEQEPEFNGYISYMQRDGHFTYWFGYGAKSWVQLESDTNQSMWSQETIDKAVELFRAKVAGPKSEVGEE